MSPISGSTATASCFKYWDVRQIVQYIYTRKELAYVYGYANEGAESAIHCKD